MKKIVIKKIKQKDVLLFDKNFSNLSFDNFSYEVVNLNEINLYCLANFLRNIFRFFFKYSLKDIYLKSLVELYNPKVVIDHEITGLAFKIKKLCKHIFCICYQLSYHYGWQKKIFKKNYEGKVIDLFAVYHLKDMNFYSNFLKTNFLISGSIKNNEIILKKKNNYEIPLLLISEFRPKQSDKLLKGQIKVCQYINTFAEKNNIIPYVALTSNREEKKGKFLEQEINFFNKYLKKFKYKKENNFITANNSNLIICINSNMGTELLSRGFKVVFFNLVGKEDPSHENPYLKINHPKYFFSNLNENEIFKRLKYFFSITKNDWLKEADIKNNTIIFDENNTLLKKEISKAIEKNK